MPCDLLAICFAARQPLPLARFWSALLGWDLVEDPETGLTLLPRDDTGFGLRFLPTQEPKRGQNRMHFDLTSTSETQQRQTVATALGMGARHTDVGQRPEERHIVLADPEGNEFCVIEPGNRFLADCGFLGAVACDGSQQVGYFWSAALGWPLVWDQDQETAIRSPHGGPKISWGGPPLVPKSGRNRLRFELATTVGSDRPSEVARLLDLGASRLEARRRDAVCVAAEEDANATGDTDAGDERVQGEFKPVMLADPDGNEFCVLPPR